MLLISCLIQCHHSVLLISIYNILVTNFATQLTSPVFQMMSKG